MLNPLTLNIKEQIILSYPHTGKKILKYQENSPWGGHILNSHDFRDTISIDITRRKLMLITDSYDLKG